MTDPHLSDDELADLDAFTAAYASTHAATSPND